MIFEASLHFAALAPSASLLGTMVCSVSWMNSGLYSVWTRLLAPFQREIYLAGSRHASHCDALSTTSQQLSSPLKSPYSTHFQPVAMVSSKGKPTDPKLREEAKEGTFTSHFMRPKLGCHNLLFS